VTLSNGTLTMGGNGASTRFDGVLSGTGTVNKTGTGAMTLGGANTFTGTLNLNQGTLALGADGVFAGGMTLVLNGGTLDTGANSNGIGNLRLLADSSIDFNSSAGVLTVINTVSATGNLSLTNWNGQIAHRRRRLTTALHELGRGRAARGLRDFRGLRDDGQRRPERGLLGAHPLLRRLV
jgi:autotransporter-associated beta strand protein